jgi:hypothetical protein
MLNPDNYCTQPAAQRLQDALQKEGMPMVETDFYHILPCQSYGMIPDGVIETKEFASKWNSDFIIPALNMAEARRLLPKTSQEMLDALKAFYGGGVSAAFLFRRLFDVTGNIDFMISLYIWLIEERKESAHKYQKALDVSEANNNRAI